jgi:hypothetical protein
MIDFALNSCLVYSWNHPLALKLKYQYHTTNTCIPTALVFPTKQLHFTRIKIDQRVTDTEVYQKSTIGTKLKILQNL